MGLAISEVSPQHYTALVSNITGQWAAIPRNSDGEVDVS